jgi:hypothetical protein
MAPGDALVQLATTHSKFPLYLQVAGRPMVQGDPRTLTEQTCMIPMLMQTVDAWTVTFLTTRCKARGHKESQQLSLQAKTGLLDGFAVPTPDFHSTMILGSGVGTLSDTEQHDIQACMSPSLCITEDIQCYMQLLCQTKPRLQLTEL